MPKITVNTKFDGGSIVVNTIEDLQNLRFKIRNDSNSHFAQWFYFQLNNVNKLELNLSIDELDKTAYPKGWEDYHVCASYDNQYWFRVQSNFQNNSLSWKITPECNTIYFAYFEPYSYSRHLELISSAACSSNCDHEVLGQTSQGRNIDLLIVGNQAAKTKIWITARQHPGETMAEWFMEGLIERLLDNQDPVSNSLLKDNVFYLVPNMNPDGAYNGNLRTNINGANLNREWLNPSIDKSPEVYFVREKMLQIGVDMFFDIHGDEALPYIFTASCADNPSFSRKQAQATARFEELFKLITPDYQTEFGYGKGHFTDDTPTIGCNWVGNQFDCLALTLEMPFKDNLNLPDPIHGWNGYRSALLGKSILTAIHALSLNN